MKKSLLALFVCFHFVYGVETYSPIEQIKIDGNARDITIHQEELSIGTDRGVLQVYNYKTKTMSLRVALPKIEDFVGDKVFARIYSVDFADGRYLLLSDSGKGGYSNLWIYENNTTTQLITQDDGKALIKARFIDKNHILLAYLSNEASLFDIESKKELYRIQLSESKFSDFALDKERRQAVFGCESGVLTLIDVQKGGIIGELKGANLDNVFRVDLKNGKVSGAGQDRRGSLYDVKSGKWDYIEGNFLIYATALSPSAQKVAFAMDEQNNISIYDVASKSKIALLKGQKSTLNSIIFKDEETLFSASDDNVVMMWKIK